MEDIITKTVGSQELINLKILEYDREYGAIATRWELINLTGIIYIITNLLDGMMYVGLTCLAFSDRYAAGEWWKRSDNKHLIKAAEVDGYQNFKVEIFDFNIKTQLQLDKLEKMYIRLFNTRYPNGYNIQGGGQSGKHTNAAKQNQSDRKSKTWYLVDYEGNEYSAPNLRTFCKEYNLSYIAMAKMVSQTGNLSSQGYALKGTDISKIKIPNQTIYKFEHIETGKIVETRSYVKLAQELGLKYSGFSALWEGRLFSYRGWKKYGTERKNEDKRLNRTYKIINSKEEILEGTNRELALKIGGTRRGISQLPIGKINHYMGWRMLDKSQIKESKYKKFENIQLQNEFTNEIRAFKKTKEVSSFLNISDSYAVAMIAGTTKSINGWSNINKKN